MYKIGITGHSPEHYSDSEHVMSSIEQTIDLLGFQYGENTIFNILGETGAGLWAADIARNKNFKYHLFLPYSFEQTCEHWYDEQKNVLLKCCNRAFSITTCYSDNSHENDSYKFLIEDSNFIICYWIGKKQGKTFDAIKYSLKNNKLALNGLDDLKLLTNTDISKSVARKKI
jgi:hypothetical protein